MLKFAMLLAAVTATAIPIDKLSLPERLQSAPASTVVQVGPQTATLAQLRTAHRAHVAAFVRAAALGRAIGARLGPASVVEPPSQYASAPADMRAFCQAAHASACMYLPPDQQVSVQQAGVADWDSLVTQAQCVQGGGSWQGMWNAYYCAFTYPSAVIVHFTPAANYKLTKSAACDRTFTYTVDEHGAIAISLNVSGIITTDDGPTCVVTVTTGA